jgi:hypothetical protein
MDWVLFLCYCRKLNKELVQKIILIFSFGSNFCPNIHKILKKAAKILHQSNITPNWSVSFKLCNQAN